MPRRATPPPLEIRLASVLQAGAALWAVVGIVLAVFGRDWLDDHDATWWLWVPVAGALIGIAGTPAARRYQG